MSDAEDTPLPSYLDILSSDEVELTKPAETTAPYNILQGFIQNITERANTPEFREGYQTFLQQLNPDGDKVVTREEMSAFIKENLKGMLETMHSVVNNEIAKGTPHEEIKSSIDQHEELRAEIQRLGLDPDQIPPSQFLSTTYMLQGMTAACETPKENLLPEQLATVEQLRDAAQQFQSDYPNLVAAIQLRSGPLDDLIFSKEEQAWIPKLTPSDAYQLPLFINLPDRAQVCTILRETMVETSASDPFRPQDTPTPPAETSPQKEPSR